MLTLGSRMDLGKTAPGDALEKPLLRQQGLGGLAVVAQLRRQGFQQPWLLLVVVDPIDQ
ncbi:hypothetical protein D3C76_1759720 [compost metagenome]